MCGIAGFVGYGTEQDLESMISVIRYRGPDDMGTYFKDSVGLAHARLSILDPSPLGHQPMLTGDSSVVIVFNGEIYNFASLRKDLDSKKKYSFKSTTDTEVILYLYKEYGERCFEKMDGMFAITLYDTQQKKLILARDRMGEKPLYWGQFNDTLIFGSELKALMNHPLCTREIDTTSLQKYLLYEFVPTPNTMLKGIHKLEPGKYLVYKEGEVNIQPYWKPDFKEQSMSFNDAKNRVEELISTSVQKQLVADVPIGVFLSGGIDSSSVAWFAQRHTSKAIKTFSMGFEDQSFDESKYAEEVARVIKSDHHHKIVSPQDALHSIPTIFAKLDEPLADASIIPTYLLSKFAREHVTVALGGDGGDELFAGYDTFKAEKTARMYEYLPESLRKGIFEPLIKRLPVSLNNFSFDFKLKKFIEGFSEAGDMYTRHQLWLGSFTDDRNEILSNELRAELKNSYIFDDLARYAHESHDANLLNRLLYQYQRTYMMDGVLVKVDRASMFNSLETRAPLLDHHLVEFTNRLPFECKLHGLTTKYILKKIMEGRLPQHILYRKKKGFGIPLGRWLRNELKDLCNDVLSADSIKKVGLFNPEYVEKLKREHFEGIRDHRKKLWTLMVFEMWRRKFID